MSATLTVSLRVKSGAVQTVQINHAIGVMDRELLYVLIGSRQPSSMMMKIDKRVADMEQRRPNWRKRQWLQFAPWNVEDLEKLLARNQLLEPVYEAAKLTVQHIPFCDDHGLSTAVAAVQTTEQTPEERNWEDEGGTIDNTGQTT